MLALLVVGLLVVVTTALVQRSIGPLAAGRGSPMLRRLLTWRKVGFAGVSAFTLVGFGATVAFGMDRLGLRIPDADGSADRVRWATEDLVVPDARGV